MQGCQPCVNWPIVTLSVNVHYRWRLPIKEWPLASFRTRHSQFWSQAGSGKCYGACLMPFMNWSRRGAGVPNRMGEDCLTGVESRMERENQMTIVTRTMVWLGLSGRSWSTRTGRSPAGGWRSRGRPWPAIWLSLPSVPPLPCTWAVPQRRQVSDS